MLQIGYCQDYEERLEENCHSTYFMGTSIVLQYHGQMAINNPHIDHHLFLKNTMLASEHMHILKSIWVVLHMILLNSIYVGIMLIKRSNTTQKFPPL
jgi:hypothetical protein